jgi:FkbM family methyltransferase
VSRSPEHFRVATLADRVHALLAKSAVLSRAYLQLWGWVLRRFGAALPVRRVISTLSWHAWPPLTFSAKSVSITDAVSFKVVPHTGEHDMRALFTSELAYEHEVFSALDQRIKGYDAIVEIGANVGFFSLYFCAARRAISVPVYCFEPSALAFTRLLENLAANDAQNVFAVPAAVADSAGLARFYEPVGHLTNGSMVESFAAIFSDQVRSTLVPTVTGDTVHSLIAVNARVLIKIDVEGAEMIVLNSLRGLIDAKRPDVVLEVLPMFVDALNEFAWPTGYRKYAITRSGLVARDRFLADGDERDYLVTASNSRAADD